MPPLLAITHHTPAAPLCPYTTVALFFFALFAALFVIHQM